MHVDLIANLDVVGLRIIRIKIDLRTFFRFISFQKGILFRDTIFTDPRDRGAVEVKLLVFAFNAKHHGARHDHILDGKIRDLGKTGKCFCDIFVGTDDI